VTSVTGDAKQVHSAPSSMRWSDPASAGPTSLWAWYEFNPHHRYSDPYRRCADPFAGLSVKPCSGRKTGGRSGAPRQPELEN
jgi:hypothetical protein